MSLAWYSAPGQGPQVRGLSHLSDRQDQQEEVGSWSPEMTLVWDLKVTHPLIDCVCILSKEENDGEPGGLSVTLSEAGWELTRQLQSNIWTWTQEPLPG